MKKRLLLALLIVATASLALGGGQAAASPDGNQSASGVTNPAVTALITNDDLFSVMDLTTLLATPGSPTQHYGPFESGSPDSGTCGNDWAEDTYDRHFTLHNNRDGTYTVVEQFKRGAFETNAGFSPGACEPDGSPGGVIAAGKTGDMHGYLIITVTGTQTSSDPSCIAGSPSAPCTTGGFIASHFAGGFTIGTFFFHYSAGDQGLLEHEWKNASPDRGGNHGDIRSG
jgi:hypothetical protein